MCILLKDEIKYENYEKKSTVYCSEIYKILSISQIILNNCYQEGWKHPDKKSCEKRVGIVKKSF